MDMHLLIFRMETKVKVWQGKYETYTIKFTPFPPQMSFLGKIRGGSKESSSSFLNFSLNNPVVPGQP